ncbi:transposase [Dietzia sp. KRD202]|uniref:transposase n=1 Tax=Dietzia sp. KRD202 TaxID=2729732 RepID=UPI0035AE49CA
MKSRFRQFTDEQWDRIEPLLPSNEGRQGHPFLDSRRVVEGIIYRYRAGIPWRDVPRKEFGSWKTVWKRHARYRDGTWDRILQEILADADMAGMSIGASRSTPSFAVPTSTARTRPSLSRTQGARSNHKNQPHAECEPAGPGSVGHETG